MRGEQTEIKRLIYEYSEALIDELDKIEKIRLIKKFFFLCSLVSILAVVIFISPEPILLFFSFSLAFLFSFTEENKSVSIVQDFQNEIVFLEEELYGLSKEMKDDA